MSIDFKRSHFLGLHTGKPVKACKYCTAERDADALIFAHADGKHEKLPRQKCPGCKAERAAQVSGAKQNGAGNEAGNRSGGAAAATRAAENVTPPASVPSPRRTLQA